MMSQNGVQCGCRGMRREENHSECIVILRPKDVTDGAYCRHVDSMVLYSALFSAFRSEVCPSLLLSLPRFFSYFDFKDKFYMKFEAVASQLWVQRKFMFSPPTPVIVAVVLQMSMCCRPTGARSFYFLIFFEEEDKMLF